MDIQNDSTRRFRLRFLPRRLWTRAIMIMVMPIILIQSVSTFLFYDNHWQSVSRRLALGIAGEIKTALSLYEAFNSPEERLIVMEKIQRDMNLRITFSAPVPVPENLNNQSFIRAEELIPAIRDVGYPFQIKNMPDERAVRLTFYTPDNTAEIILPYKRFFSSTTYVFVSWFLFSSLLFTGIAVLFLRNQIRPVLRLSNAAKNFGLGRDIDKFKPEGALEVRQAALSFLQMRDRIKRHIEERTRMLAGVSHDLRTPLTRMKLALTMMGDDENIRDLLEDVSEMERMVNGYLDFARGEGGEKMASVDVGKLVAETVASLRKDGVSLQFISNGSPTMEIRRNDFKRCLWNLITNAERYGTIVNVEMKVDEKSMDISVEDNGPGIPADKREDVFKAFFRLDESRNSETGGVGLGLSITRDIVLAHGGKIYMEDSTALGGLRVVMHFPL